MESLDLDPALTKADRNTSLADLMSQWSAIKGPAQFYYSTNYMIDVTTLCLLKRRINMFARKVNDLAPLERQHQIMGLFIARNLECVKYPQKQQCCPNTPNRKITRSIYEKSHEIVREINKSDIYKAQFCAEHKKVEILFAHMKRNLGFDRLRLRGLKSAADEFLLVATAQNLRRLTRLASLPEHIKARFAVVVRQWKHCLIERRFGLKRI